MIIIYDRYIDIGEDPEEEILEELQKRVDGSKQIGLSDSGVKELKKILFDNKPVFE